MEPKPQQADALDKWDRWHRCLDWSGDMALGRCKWHLQGSMSLAWWNAIFDDILSFPPFPQESPTPWECLAAAVLPTQLPCQCRHTQASDNLPDKSIARFPKTFHILAWNCSWCQQSKLGAHLLTSLPTADGMPWRPKDGFQITSGVWRLVAKCFGRKSHKQIASLTVAPFGTQSRTA